MDHHRLRADISVLIWLFRSRHPGKEVLEAAVELIVGIVDECYVILDPGGARTRIRADVLALLDDLATGKIRADSDSALLSYLVNRYRTRLIPNLFDARLIAERKDFVPVEMDKEEFLDWLSVRVDPGFPVSEKRGNLGMNSVSLAREIRISRIGSFFPGCLAENARNLAQKELF